MSTILRAGGLFTKGNTLNGIGSQKLPLPGVRHLPARQPVSCVPIIDDWSDGRSTRVRTPSAEPKQVIKHDLPQAEVAGLMAEAAHERLSTRGSLDRDHVIQAVAPTSLIKLRDGAMTSGDSIKVVRKKVVSEEATVKFSADEAWVIGGKDIALAMDSNEGNNRCFDGLRIAGFPVGALLFCAIMVSLTVGIIVQMMRSGEESAAVVRTAQVAAVQRFAPKVVIVPEATPLVVPAPAKQPQKQITNLVEPPKLVNPRVGRRHALWNGRSKSEVDHNL